MSASCVDRAWPESGAAPALMLGYQKSLGRRTALGPGGPIVLRHTEEVLRCQPGDLLAQREEGADGDATR